VSNENRLYREINVMFGLSVSFISILIAPPCLHHSALSAPMVSPDYDRNQLWPRHMNTRCPQNCATTPADSKYSSSRVSDPMKSSCRPSSALGFNQPLTEMSTTERNNKCLWGVQRPPLWSSGQSSWLQTQRSRVRVSALPDFLSSSGSGTGYTQPL
jgi:hypothetical protein